MLRRSACALALLAALHSADAMTVVQRSFPELVHQADLVFVGTVQAIRNEWDQDRRSPFTLVTFTNLTVLKGTDPAGDVTLYFFGGTAPDGTLVSVPGIPRFLVGEKTVVFCAGNRRVFCPLVGIWQGLLRVLPDPTRREEIVVDAFYTPIADLGGADTTFRKLTDRDTSAAPLTLLTLIQHIETELGRSHEQR